MHWTSICTIWTSCTRYCNTFIYHIRRIMYKPDFFIIKRYKILHITCIVKKLFHITHTAKNHSYIWQTRNKSDSPGWYWHIFIISFEFIFNLFWYFGKCATFNWLHNYYWFVMLCCNLIAFSWLNSLTFPVKIINL